MIRIPLCLSYDHDCSYLDHQIARSVNVDPRYPMSTALYGELIQQGFRRSGGDVYKPYCQHCQACLPARVNVAAFTPNRSQKRCLLRNADTHVVVKPAAFDEAHYQMYLRYQASRHEGGSMMHLSPDDYMGFLSSDWCNTAFVEFSIAGELAAVAVVDQLEQAWSAVYTFFDPKFAVYSPGVYAVLWQIGQLAENGLTFLYLGFWIKACKKMAYKNAYQPLQVRVGEQWLDVIE